jgi:excisionase family DNA binding protein
VPNRNIPKERDVPEKDEFFSFEEALDELRLKEEELKRLVSEGEIRAFREGETMRLRKQDVESLRNELSGGEVVDLGGVDEELVFEDDADLDAGMATEEISEADTILEDDDVEDIGEVELERDVASQVAVAAGVGAPRVRRTTSAVAALSAEEDADEGSGLRIAAILTSAIMVLALPVCLAAASGHVSSIARGIAGIFGAKIPQ